MKCSEALSKNGNIKGNNNSYRAQCTTWRQETFSQAWLLIMPWLTGILRWAWLCVSVVWCQLMCLSVLVDAIAVISRCDTLGCLLYLDCLVSCIRGAPGWHTGWQPPSGCRGWLCLHLSLFKGQGARHVQPVCRQAVFSWKDLSVSLLWLPVCWKWCCMLRLVTSCLCSGAMRG